MSITKRKAINVRRALWILLAVMTMLSACKKDPKDPDPGTTPATKPEIASFTPARGTPGTIVTIQGKNFKANALQNYVKFEGATLEAFITDATTTALTVRVPQNAVTGKIIVKVGNESDTSATDFTVDPEVTSITDFTPKQGALGTPVTITGTKFGNDIKVKINDIEASVTQRSATQIVFTIPINTTLTSHKITVISGTDVLQTADNFTVIPSGPYARWEYKNVDLFPDGTTAFPFGLSFVYKNKIYWGFTGLSFNEAWADYVVYDPAQHAQGWVLQNRPPADMAPEDLVNAVAIVHNDRVFIGTGLTGSTASKKWWEFHPADLPGTSTATRLTDFPQAVAHAAAFTMNNKVFVGFGGVNKDLYEFNPAGNNNLGSWTLSATGTFRELNTGNGFVLGNEAFLGPVLPALSTPRNAIYKFTEPGQLTRVTDLPEDVTTLNTPSFTIGNKGYFIVGKKVWEYTPGATGGTWRVVISRTDSPTIGHIAMLTVNGLPVVYGWNADGRLYEFKF